MQKKGFTLVEVFIVIIIIAILVGIALPQYINILEKSSSSEALVNLESLRASMQRYWYDQIATTGNYNRLTWAIGTREALLLDLDNPNNPDSKWLYGLPAGNGDTGNIDGAAFIIETQKQGKQNDYWIQVKQDGDVKKSIALGGDGIKF